MSSILTFHWTCSSHCLSFTSHFVSVTELDMKVYLTKYGLFCTGYIIHAKSWWHHIPYLHSQHACTCTCTCTQVGGQVHLHGMPGGSTTPSWCRLIATANPGATSLVLDCGGAVAWPVGGRIAVASTDFDKDQAETFFITSGDNRQDVIRSWWGFKSDVTSYRATLIFNL